MNQTKKELSCFRLKLETYLKPVGGIKIAHI